MNELLDYLNKNPAVVAALLMFSATVFIIPLINHVSERQHRLLQKNLDLKKSLNGELRSDKLDQVIQYQLNKYARTQYDKYKYQRGYYWILILFRIISYVTLAFSYESFRQNFILGGWVASVIGILTIVFEFKVYLRVYKGVLPKTKFIASLIDGTHKGANLKLQEQVLNSGRGRNIGSPWIFIYNSATLTLDAYKNLKIDPSKFHKRFLREKLRVIQYEYSHTISADGAYKELADYPVIAAWTLTLRHVNFE